MALDRFPILGRATSIARDIKNAAGKLTNQETSHPLSNFKPEGYNAAFNANRASVDMPEKLSSTDNFNHWESNKIKGMADFGSITLPDGDTISKKMSTGNVKAADVSKAITEAIALNPKTLTAKEKFNGRIAALNEKLKNSPEAYDFVDYAEFLHNLKAKTKTAIEDQHKEEKTKLEALFEKPEFTSDLMSVLGLFESSQLATVKKQMLEQMDKKHQEDAKKFEEGLNDEITKFHEAEQNERDRIAYQALMDDISDAMRAETDKLIRERDEKDQTKTDKAGISVGFDSNGSARFKGISVKDRQIIQDATGEQINHTKDANGNDVFSMKLPRRFFAPLYSSHAQSNAMAGIANAVRACGYKKITMEINHQGRSDLQKGESDEYAMELGRKAYAECLKSGFDYHTKDDPNDKEKKNKLCDIVIKVNGEPKTADELFAKCKNRLAKLHAQADKDQAKRKAFRENQKSPPERQKAFKQEIKANHAKAEEAKKKAESAATPSSSGPLSSP